MDVSVSGGRHTRLIEMLKEEMSFVLEQQKNLNQQIHKMDALLKKL